MVREVQDATHNLKRSVDGGVIGGKNVLISRDFYYFGSRAIPLPSELLSICNQRQGHRSTKNAPYFKGFVEWIRKVAPEKGQLYGWPDFIIDWREGPEARAVMLLRFQEDLDPPEIATLLDMPVNTVKSHLRRSLEWLRAQCTGGDHGS